LNFSACPPCSLVIGLLAIMKPVPKYKSTHQLYACIKSKRDAQIYISLGWNAKF
jgi:hypothetical protein